MLKYKRILAVAIASILSFGFPTSTTATLIDNGGGLIYDTLQNITWYDFSKTDVIWPEANSWATTLNVSGITGWRLPIVPFNQYGQTGEGELSFLYYHELGNVFGGPLKKGPFVNLLRDWYWTGSWYPGEQNFSRLTFNFQYGRSDGYWMDLANYNAMAVHSGNVAPDPTPTPTPEPSTLILFTIGLAGLIYTKRK